MYGYPNNKPSGFTDDEARQATANALRFWLSEQGEGYSYDFTNRRSNPNAIRAKSGYEHVLEYADELLAKARARQDLPHGVDFSPSTVQLTASGNGYVGQTSVLLTNINSGYTLDTSRLPSGSRVSGYTGGRSETLTITLPASAAGQSFNISAEGMDTRSIDNITAYVPANGSLQKVFLCATTAQVVATAQLSIGAPEAQKYGKIQLVKTGKDNMPLAGVVFGIYSDADCKNKLVELTTDSDGIAISGDLPVGTVYIKELSTIKPYVLSAEIKSLEIEGFELGLCLQNKAGGDLAAADGGHELFQLGNLPDVGALVDEAAHMDRQPAAVHIVGLVAQEIEKLGIDHAGKEVEGVVCVGNDDKQRRFPVAQRVQLQLVIRRDLPQLVDVEGGKARTAAN